MKASQSFEGTFKAAKRAASLSFVARKFSEISYSEVSHRYDKRKTGQHTFVMRAAAFQAPV